MTAPEEETTLPMKEEPHTTLDRAENSGMSSQEGSSGGIAVGKETGGRSSRSTGQPTVAIPQSVLQRAVSITAKKPSIEPSPSQGPKVSPATNQ